MLSTIFGWLSGGIIGQIGKELRGAYEAKLNAKTDKAKLAADQSIATLQAQRDVLLREQNSKLTAWIRPAFAGVLFVYVSKVVIWDKVLGLGVTDDLSPEFHNILWTVLGAYFLARPFEKWSMRK